MTPFAERISKHEDNCSQQNIDLILSARLRGKKVGKLAKLLDDVTRQWDPGVETDVISWKLLYRWGAIVAGARCPAVTHIFGDMVMDKLEKQAEKYKTKLARKMKNGSVLDIVPQPSPPTDREPVPQLVRTKRFPVKPMPVEEALLQMNLLGHDFFVFRNADTEEVNVVYRRKDGNYGLIEPLR